jgi:penicillin-binding protein 2
MRIFLLRGLTILIAALFLFKLLELQVMNTSYRTLSENNAVLEIADYPERGFIYDRNGTLLVANQPAYDVMIIPKNASPFDTLSFCKLTGISKKRLIYNLKGASIF